MLDFLAGVRYDVIYSQENNKISVLTHRGRVTHICDSELAIIGSDNRLSPVLRKPLSEPMLGYC